MKFFKKRKKKEPMITLYTIEGSATTNAELEKIFGRSFENNAEALEEARQKLLKAWSKE